jgi:hypothetical protein
MPAYNNSRHIAAAIESVLAQTMADLELVVVDDGSGDDTAAVVRRFDDPRIVLLCHPHRGAAEATNAAVRAARGRYIALFAADDVCRPERLERELAHLAATGQRIVFSGADFIDESGEALTREHFASGWFNHPSRTRAEMLAWFFFRGNYLCTVTCLAEKSLFLEAGLFPATSAQLPDFAMWLALITRHELGLIPDRLIAYRVHGDGSNASAPANSRRAYFELCQIYRNMFVDCPAELFREAFAGRLTKPDFADGAEYALEQSFLYLQHDIPAVRALGLERLYQQLQDPVFLDTADRVYAFDVPKLLDLTNSFDATTAVEFLETRDWALGLEHINGCLVVERDAAKVEIESLQAHIGAVKADRQILQSAYQATLEEVRKTQEEYWKLDAYTRQALAAKDEALNALARLQAAAGGSGRTRRLRQAFSRVFVSARGRRGR